MQCDLAIIGAGPAGLTAALYGARAGLDVKILEMGVPGGQLVNTDWIENYPGFPKGLTGAELMQHFTLQATAYSEVELIMGYAKHVEKKEKRFIIHYDEKSLEAGAIIIASGARPRTLGVPGENELTGSGVSYCAVCDGAFFRDKEVAVVGGGDTALEDAGFLSKIASKVTVIHRRDQFRGARILQDRVRANDKIELAMSKTVEEIVGENKVEALKLKDAKTGEISTLPVEGVFILVGTQPNTGWINDIGLEIYGGYLETDNEMRTSVPGVFGAGDVRKKILRQVTTAVGDAATAAMSAARYIEGL